MNQESLSGIVRDKSIAFVALPAILAACVFLVLDLRIPATILLAVGMAVAMIYLERAVGFARQPGWMIGVAIMFAGILIMIDTQWQGAIWIVTAGIFFPQGDKFFKSRS